MRAILKMAWGLAVLTAACASDSQVTAPRNGRERLSAVPIASTVTSAPGRHELSIATTKDAYLVIPAGAPTSPLPLLVMLHGAGGAEAPITQIIETAQRHGVAVLVPKSRQATWDAALGTIGEDVVVMDRALREAFKRVRVDPSRIALAGFSDGASYSLMIGIANGDLFSHVIAFAPGFLSPVDRFGEPAIFIAHGQEDVVTSSRNTQDNIIPFLHALGYQIQFHGFIGGHQVTPGAADAAFDWFMKAQER